VKQQKLKKQTFQKTFSSSTIPVRCLLQTKKK
jgi:hypothetical protein